MPVSFCGCVSCRGLFLPSDADAYLVVNDYGRFGVAYVETETAEADRETVIRSLITGQHSNVLSVIAFNVAEGWSRDVSAEIARAVLKRAIDGDDNLGPATKAFIDRYCGALDRSRITQSS
jgi:hypothetical protein